MKNFKLLICCLGFFSFFGFASIDDPSSISKSTKEIDTIPKEINELNTIIYASGPGIAKTALLKLVSNSIYINTAQDGKPPKWTLLMYYDNISSIFDMNKVRIMKYDGNYYMSISGQASVSYRNEDIYSLRMGGPEWINAVEDITTTGFSFKTANIAYAQFCGEQKFVIQKSENPNIYYTKTPDNYYYNSEYEDILKSAPNLTFEIINSKGKMLDFASIYFIVKYLNNDINPCN